MNLDLSHFVPQQPDRLRELGPWTKPGDRVVCMEDKGHPSLVIGQFYSVRAIGNGVVTMDDAPDPHHGYLTSRFRHLDHAPAVQMDMKALKEGKGPEGVWQALPCDSGAVRVIVVGSCRARAVLVESEDGKFVGLADHVAFTCRYLGPCDLKAVKP